MNVKEYISSGIVESYVMGLASEQERTEFEMLCTQHPELIEARTNFELKLERQAMENAVSPSVGNKEKIWSVIQQLPSSNTSKIVNMESATTRKSSGIRWVAAASIILLIAAGYFAYDFYTQNQKLRKSNNDLEARLNSVDSTMNKIKEDRDKMTNENTIVVNMVGTRPSSPSANIYWDTTSTNVFLVVKNMPKLASDKQYQLWALLDGKPTDLGLFDGGNEKIILKMKNVQKADAFAITIEQKGNTGGPHLEDLQTMGKAKL